MVRSVIVSTDHSYSFKRSFNFFKEKPDLKLYSDILKLSPFTWLVDRTQLCKLPFDTHFKSEYELPTTEEMFCDSLENICQNEAEKYKNTDEKIYILWSGGIDSTLLIVSFLKSSVPRDRIVIACNFDSIKENYNFYIKHILPNFEIISADLLIQMCNISKVNGTILNGDPADVLYGYDLTISISKILGFDYLQLPYNRDNVTNYFTKKGFSNQSANLWYDYFNYSMIKSPKPIKTMQDFSWWEGFNYRWQAANEKFQVRISLENSCNYKQFFKEKQFQFWSIFRQVNPIRRFNDIKIESKKIIFEYTKDQQYFEKKIKLNSNSHVFGSNTHSAILNDGCRLTSKEFDIFEFYNENNFIKDWLSI